MQLQERSKRALSLPPPPSQGRSRCPARPRRRAPASPRPLRSCTLTRLSVVVVAAAAGPWRPAFCCGAPGLRARRCRLRAAAASVRFPREPSGAATPVAPLASPPTYFAGTASWAAVGSRPPPPSLFTTRPAAPRWAPWPIAGCPRPELPCAPPTMPFATGKGSRSR